MWPRKRPPDGPADRQKSRLTLLLITGVLALLVTLFFFFTSRHPGRLAPEKAILEEQVAALEKLAAGARAGSILQESEALIAVDGQLLERLLMAAMPIETIIDKKYAVRLDSADVSMDDGMALVRLGGRATLVGQPPEQSFADATVYGALDILEFDPDEGALRGKIRVIAFDAKRVKLFGNEDQSVLDVAVGIGRLRLGSFEELSHTIEIPVRLGRSLLLPEVGPEGGVHIPEARIPLTLEVRNVRAFNERLWVSACVAATPPNQAPADSSTDSSILSKDPAKEKGKKKKVRDRRPDRPATQEQRTALRDTVAVLLARDPIVKTVRSDSAGILVILPEKLLQDLVTSVATFYLDRVELKVVSDLTEHESGVIRASTPLGKVKAGEWSLDLLVHDLSGVLKHGTPRISLVRGGSLELELPTRIEEGSGSATIDFGWDPSALGSVVCRGFHVRRTLQGVIKPQEHLIRGSLRVAAGERSLTAFPEFIQEKFPIQLDLTPASWDSIRVALEEQDKLFKCGTVMDPDDVIARLKSRGEQGIPIRLPPAVFRSFELPASVTKMVRIAGRTVPLTVLPEQVRTTDHALWYGATVLIGDGAPLIPVTGH